MSEPAPVTGRDEPLTDQPDPSEPSLQLHEPEVARTSLEVGGGSSENVEVSVLLAQEGIVGEERSHDVDAEPGSLEVIHHSAALLPSPMEITIPDPSTIESLHAPDSPTTSLITSLRSQLTLLSDQSTALNTKLIEAISRHADLEDVHLNLQQKHTSLEEKAKGLEVEKNRWEESMNTGLLVEGSQIREEMQRLANGLVEEERRRGSAEERRQKVESEVDDLAASLFDQANTMVAVERMARTKAEDRLKETEENLAAAESAVRDMQLHLQSLPASGGASSPPPTTATSIPRRYLASHLPYSEFLSFLSHLRALRPLKDSSKALFPPPLITALAAQPFIARMINEDHDPTIRLDSAPDLSYFSRRNVGPAIIAGELVIEPVSANTLLGSTTSLAHEIGCSLCGKPVFPNTVPQSPATSQFGPPPNHPTQRSSRFSLKPFFNAASSPSGAPAGGASPSQTQSPLASPSPAGSSLVLSSVYIFRVARPATIATGNTEKETKLYPLCKSGWCLERLRAACELWHFVRTGIIHVVWHGDDGYLLLAEGGDQRRVSASQTTITAAGGGATGISTEKEQEKDRPALPERKKSGGWGLGFKLGSNERKSEGSGGAVTSGWFGRSGSATPPISPNITATEKPDPASESGNKVESLEEPIDLDQGVTESTSEKQELERVSEAKKDVIDVPRIEEHEASPIAPIRSNEGTETHGESGEEMQERLQPKRTDSSHSLTTSNAGTEEGSFSTPKGVHSELEESPNPNDEKQEDTSPKDAEAVGLSVNTNTDIEAIDLASPLPSSSTSEFPGSPGTTDKPPPIPRRAAARLSAQVKSSNNSASNSPVEGSNQSPRESESISREATPTVVEEHTEESARKRPPPPPLPPRHPRTPTAQVVDTITIDGEKRWMRVPDVEKGESETWEEKTWKTIIKLKEGMCKARVGVSDETD